MAAMTGRLVATILSVGLALTVAGCTRADAGNGAGPSATVGLERPDSAMPSTRPDSAESTVATTQADATRSQTLYLWERGNVPATTVYTDNNGGYADPPSFRPTITSVPVPAGTPVKGAVLINAGGAFRFRSDQQWLGDIFATN